MRVASRKALSRMLTELGLDDWLPQCRLTADVKVTADRMLHGVFCPCTGGIERSMSISDVLAWSTVCRDCDKDLANEVLDVDLSSLVFGLLTVRAAQRLTGRLGSVSGKVRGKTMRDLQNVPGRIWSTDQALQAAGQLVSELAQQQLAAMHQAEQGEDARAGLLQMVRDDLVPPGLRGIARLDETPHLIGIYPRNGGTDALAAVYTSFAVPDCSGQVLRAPRYLADYLQREIGRSHGDSFVLLAPVGDATAEQIDVAARLWSPHLDGPMGDLRQALETACGVLAH